MAAYLLRRLLLVVPTLFGIMVLNFFIVQTAPGGPVEQMIAKIQGTGVNATERFSGGGDRRADPAAAERRTGGAYRGARGLPPEVIQRIERMYGFDKPIYERFWIMMKSYAVFDFGDSFFRNRRVVDLVLDKMPVSISLGLWTTLLDLPDLDPARHPQGGPRRQPLRHRELERADRAERHPGLPVRHPAGRAVRRRHLREVVPAARPGVRRLGDLQPRPQDRSTISGTWCCRSAPW